MPGQEFQISALKSVLGIDTEWGDIRTVQSLTLTEAQEHLSEVVRGLASGAEVVITDAEKPMAKLSAVKMRSSLRDLTPESVGAILVPYPRPEDDTLSEMLDART